MAAAGAIQGDTFDLKELFGQARYQIEYYQREYSWSAQDVSTLLEDLFEAFETLQWKGKVPSPRPS
ncbi:DUF262 domain-containing protein [Streptomyces hokutonensis]|uniref:DUF262 domain-containing protein n=1 Tax=Streptomyces hokutonensis TaxID=1306990 RepID=UPI000377BA87|nr:DUF262 domain-containing protein [Streptomyces hokutonensis]